MAWHSCKVPAPAMHLGWLQHGWHLGLSSFHEANHVAHVAHCGVWCLELSGFIDKTHFDMWNMILYGTSQKLCNSEPSSGPECYLNRGRPWMRFSFLTTHWKCSHPRSTQACSVSTPTDVHETCNGTKPLQSLVKTDGLLRLSTA